MTRPAASSRTREIENVADQGEISSADLPHAPNKKSLKRTRHRSKSDVIHALLKRPDGAAIPALAKATGWQPHSVRSFLSRLKKDKRAGLKVLITKDGARRYRISGGK